MSNRRPKTVGKDFSALKVKKRIDLTAVSIYQALRPRDATKAYEPRTGTQVHRLWATGKLDHRQQQAWRAFRVDFESAKAKSGGITSSYGEYVEKGGDNEKVLTAYSNAAHERIERLMARYLIKDEALLLFDLLQDDLVSRGNFDLEVVGFLKSGYKKDETAKANGAGHVQALLTRVASYYGL